MSVVAEIERLRRELPEGVTLVAVSKTHPAQAVQEAYDAGQRVFGESRPQEMCAKHAALPADIRWHQIGHLQTNKVRSIAPFVAMIESVDSVRLLEAIDREAVAAGRRIDVLLEVHVAREATKTGWGKAELEEYLAAGRWRSLEGVAIRGLMAIATYTDDTDLIKSEFCEVRDLFGYFKERYFGERFDTLSMGMTSDYKLAVACGSTQVRIGSLIFGNR